MFVRVTLEKLMVLETNDGGLERVLEGNDDTCLARSTRCKVVGLARFRRLERFAHKTEILRCLGKVRWTTREELEEVSVLGFLHEMV